MFQVLTIKMVKNRTKEKTTENMILFSQQTNTWFSSALEALQKGVKYVPTCK